MRRLLILAALCMCACASPRPTFDGARAFADLERQTDFGPRIPGTVGHSECARWLNEQFGHHADSTWVQEFNGMVQGSPDTAVMQNIVARFNPDASKRVMISAHWDKRPYSDRDPDSTLHTTPVLGGNDGASGVAVLLELARMFDSVPPPVGVDLVLYDGEDGGEYRKFPGRWCQGSFYFAKHLPAHYQWAINVDMIGDKDLAIPIEGHSFRLAPELVDRVWDKAAELNEIAFQRVRGSDTFDDHMPILMKGIPAIDIIDFDYAYWHTTMDTPDKCSAASLATVGRVVAAVIYDM
jgi:glutaminyl-peptide cyclotransferase